MSQLNLKIQLQAFDRVSKQFSNIRKAGGRLGRQFDDNLKELRKLDAQMKNVNSFRKRERELSKLGNELDAAKNKSREFKQQLANAKQSNATTTQLQKLSQQYQKAQQKTIALISSHKQLKTSLGQAGEKLKQAGLNTKDLAGAESQLKSRIESVNSSLNKQSTALDKVSKRQRKLNTIKDKFRGRIGRSQNMAMAGYAGMAVGRKTNSVVSGMLRPGIGFGEQMSAVQAKLRIDKKSDDFKSIRKQALDLGSSTSFSASEVGGGQEFLAMAGFGVDAIKASMPDVLNLAKAANTDLATTADITSNIAGAFKIDPSATGTITRLSDVLAYTTTTANVDMVMLGETMKYLAQADDLKLSLEQAAAMTGMLGNVGIQGTMAGTTIRTMMNNLSAPAKAGRDAMDELGVKFADTGDNAKDFVVFLQDIADKTKKMGSVAKAQYIKDIFGKNAVSGVTELINQAGSGKLNKYVESYKKIDDVTKNMADTMADNTGGDIKELTSAWEGLNIALTDTEEGPLRNFIKTSTKIVRSISGWIKANPKLAGAILTTVAVVGSLIGVMGGLLIVIAGILGPFAILRMTMSMLGMGSVGLASKGGLLTKAFRLLGGAGKWLIRIVLLLGRAFLMNPIGLAVTGIAASVYLIYKYWEPISAFFKNLWSTVSNWFATTWELLKTDTVAGIAKIGAVIVNWSPHGLVYKAFSKVMSYFGVELPNSLTGLFSKIGSKIKGVISGWHPIDWIKGVFKGAFDWIDKKLGALAGAWKKFKSMIGIDEENESGAKPKGHGVSFTDMTKTAGGVMKTVQIAQNADWNKIGNVLGIEKIKAMVADAQAKAAAMKKEPITIQQDATKNMNYQGNHNITVNTDGSVLSAHVAELVGQHMKRQQAAQDAKARAMMFDGGPT